MRLGDVGRRAAPYIGLAASLLCTSPASAQAPPETATPPPPATTPTPAPTEPPAPALAPLGFAGGGTTIERTDSNFVPLPDRWRIGFPEWQRYVRGNAANPYRQNVLKGDSALFGQKTFFNLTAVSDTLGEIRRIPVAGGVSTQRPGSEDFFGRGEQVAFVQEFVLSLSLFHGDAAYKPRDWEVRFTPVGNINYLHAQEQGIVNIDVRRGNNRTDRFVGVQEGFGEIKLFDVSPFYDFVSVRAGIQGFTSDFRGFVFSDNNLGARLFGNFASNRYQWNLAVFDQLEKNTNSGLNTFKRRDQKVGIANLYAQDFLVPGYTTQLSFLYNEDDASLHFNENGFLERPAPIGNFQPHALHVSYLGWTGEGHLGRVNISHAFYEAFGTDEENPIAGRKIHVNAQFAALELSFDVDWWRPIVSVLWSSGDKNPTDGQGRGFSAIFDNPNFAGGPISFWNREVIPLTQTGVRLVNGNSLIPDLRTSKDEGQANYVNPGLFLYGLGLDFKLTQQLTLDVNTNYLRFQHTEPIELLLFQPHIRKEIGWDFGLGLRWRPMLNQQMIVEIGGAGFRPGQGFKDIYASQCQSIGCGTKAKFLYQAFTSLVFAY